jgi:GNAT superfamily N-acetyltransferase
MSETVFRQLRPDELTAAYDIVLQATRWLRSIGSPQWSQVMPFEVYQKRQERGQNYGLFVDGILGFVMSLKPELPVYWQSHSRPEQPLIWLCTFAGADAVRGHGLGSAALVAAENHVRTEKIPVIYLDCYYAAGVLPRFYESVGYTLIDRKDEVFAGITFDIILMHKQLLLNG